MSPSRLARLRLGQLGIALILATLAPSSLVLAQDDRDGPHLANGLRIFEVDANSATIWTRTTRLAQRNPDRDVLPIVLYLNENGALTSDGKNRSREPKVVRFPEDQTIDDLDGAVPGMPGQVRAIFGIPRDSGRAQFRMTPWVEVDPNRDFTAQLEIPDLEPNSSYALTVEARPADSPEDAPATARVEGSFRTAPATETVEPITFTVSTGQAYNDRDNDQGYLLYDGMLTVNPDFFVHTGDIVYYDKLGKSPALARWHWQRTYSLPSNLKFHRQVATYFIKDDHDTLVDDCWPTMPTRHMAELTFAEGLKIFREQAGMRGPYPTYRTYRWGKDLQIWMVEGRDYRSPNPMPDGPDKTIWGQEQIDWFMETVQASDATFRLLISPTPLVGPDRTNKNDNHSNAGFQFEGNRLRQFLTQQDNMAVVCGDRHWQYHSVDPATGLNEFSCGPASEAHAGGWRQSDYREDYHQYLKVAGGFLAVTVDRPDDIPTATFAFHDVNGQLRYQYQMTANQK